jgi:hypothetical protein
MKSDPILKKRSMIFFLFWWKNWTIGYMCIFFARLYCFLHVWGNYCYLSETLLGKVFLVLTKQKDWEMVLKTVGDILKYKSTSTTSIILYRTHTFQLLPFKITSHFNFFYIQLANSMYPKSQSDLYWEHVEYITW